MSRLSKLAAGFALVPLLALTAAPAGASASGSSARTVGALATLALEPRTHFAMQPDGSSGAAATARASPTSTR